MSWRYLPPVHSPISMAGMMAGLRAFLAGGERARRELAAQLVNDLQAERVVLTDSGTSALALAMKSAMQLTGRNHVALPGYGCYDLVTALNAAGAGVVLYDVDPATLGPDWASFEAALATAPAAVVVVHLYGLPVDMDQVRSMADRAKVPVIEDAAQGAGGSWRGRPLGSLGDLGVLSFGRGKGITGGSGGALVVSRGWDGPVQAPVGGGRGLRDLVVLAAQVILGRPMFYRIPASLPFLRLGETVYHEPWPAGPISAVAAAAAKVAWEARRLHASQRTRVADALRPTLPAPAPFVMEGAGAGWLRYPIMLEGRLGGVRDGLESGMISGYPMPLQALPDLPGPVRVVATPGSERLAESLCTLPTHHWVRKSDLAKLAELSRSKVG